MNKLENISLFSGNKKYALSRASGPLIGASTLFHSISAGWLALPLRNQWAALASWNHVAIAIDQLVLLVARRTGAHDRGRSSARIARRLSAARPCPALALVGREAPRLP